MGNTVETTREIDCEQKRIDALFKFIRSGDCYLPNEFKNDKEFIIDTINIGIAGRICYSLPKDLANDDDIFESLVNNDEYIPKSMLHKITSEENALRLYVNDSVMDKYRFLNKTLQNDKSFALKVLSKSPGEYFSMPHEIRFDEEVQIEAIKLKGTNLCFASDTAKRDTKLVKLAIDGNPYALQHASEELKDDYDIVFYAIQKNPHVLCFASKRLINDKVLLKHVLDNDEYVDVREILPSIERENLLDFIKPFMKRFKEKPFLVAYLDESILNGDFIMDIIFDGIPMLAKYIKHRHMFPAPANKFSITVIDNDKPTKVIMRKRNKK